MAFLFDTDNTFRPMKINIIYFVLILSIFKENNEIELFSTYNFKLSYFGVKCHLCSSSDMRERCSMLMKSRFHSSSHLLNDGRSAIELLLVRTTGLCNQLVVFSNQHDRKKAGNTLGHLAL